MPKTIRLSAEYECHPLWRTRGSGEDNFSPFDLPISKELAEGVEHWADEFEATYNRQDPASSGFKSPEELSRFTETGLLLARRLREELSDEWEVVYFNRDTRSREVIDRP